MAFFLQSKKDLMNRLINIIISKEGDAIWINYINGFKFIMCSGNGFNGCGIEI